MATKRKAKSYTSLNSYGSVAPYSDSMSGGFGSTYGSGSVGGTNGGLPSNVAPPVSNPYASFSTDMGPYLPDHGSLANTDGGMFSSLSNWWNGENGVGGNKDWLMGNKETPGLLPTGIGLGTNIVNALSAWGNYQTGKDSFAASKERYAQDYAMQRNTLRDSAEQRTRNGANYAGLSKEDADAKVASRLNGLGLA
jgi:hypothetical protein